MRDYAFVMLSFVSFSSFTSASSQQMYRLGFSRVFAFHDSRVDFSTHVLSSSVNMLKDKCGYEDSREREI